MKKKFLMLFTSASPMCSPLLLASLLLISCAGQVAPSGGPVDAIPPQLVRTEPDTNAVRVQTDRIVLEFSEYVDRRTVEESIFISPHVGDLEFDWSGREVAMTFIEPLKKQTTYVVTIGTDVRDVRASNRMSQSFTLAFSTGDSIDQGTISGQVFDEKPEGVMMFAYALDELNPDTLDPSHVKPDYITQTGQNGMFSFSNLRLGTYRILAVRDEYRNLIYDKQTDQFGVTARDVLIRQNEPAAADLRFRLSREDTTRPFITKVVPLNQRQLLVRFSEPLDTMSVAGASFLLTDTLGRNPVPLLLQTVERGDSLATRVLTSVPLDSGAVYRMSVKNVVDLVGNRCDSTGGVAVFTGIGTPDTLKPTFEVVGISDSSREVPLESSFEVRFSEPVRQSSLLSGIRLVDSLKREVTHARQWITASSVMVAPKSLLGSKAWYAIRVVMDSVRDVAGNSWKDSVRTIRFQSLDLRSTGSIEGNVMDTASAGGQGAIVLTAARVHSAMPAEKTQRLKQAGKFRFEQLPEGSYTLRAYRDSDSSLTYSFGSPYPFKPSERFVVARDTTKVRARWGVDGVLVKFPSSTR